MASLLWGLALVAAVLWPGRIIGPLDGAPLDAPLEAILIGLVLPILWTLDPRFLRGGLAKALVVLLLTWKIATAVFLTQGGWCGEFLTPQPPPGSYRLDRSWDLRTFLEASPAACSGNRGAGIRHPHRVSRMEHQRSDRPVLGPGIWNGNRAR